MFDRIIGATRQTAVDALPEGVFTEVLHDALESDIALMSKTSRFAAIQTEYGDPIQATIGPSPRFIQDGILIIRLYEPDGSGDGDQLTYASNICDLLRSKAVSGTGYRIRFVSPGIANGIKEGSHHVREIRANLDITFYPQLAS